MRLNFRWEMIEHWYTQFFVQKIAAGAYNAFHGSDPVRFKRFVAAMGANESDFDNI